MFQGRSTFTTEWETENPASLRRFVVRTRTPFIFAEALDKFDAPRFRPPSDMDFVKTYKATGEVSPQALRGPSPLESPPPLTDLRDEDLMVGHLMESPPAHFVPSSSFALPEDPFPSGDTPPMPRPSDIPPMSTSLYTPPEAR